MNGSEKRFDLTIGVKNEGLENLAKVTQGLDSASEEAAELRQQAGQVADALNRVAQQQQAIDRLRQMGGETRQLSQAMDAASADVQRLDQALSDTARHTQATAAAHQSASQAVQATQADLKSMQAVLADYRAGSDRAARGTDDYKASVAQARSAIAELRAQLAEQRQSLRDSAEASRQAEAAEKALRREYEGAVDTARRTSRALGEHRRALDGAREAAARLGVDSRNLGQTQKQVDAAARAAQAGLDEAAAAANRISQRQQQAARAAQDFQADLRKLGLQGAQAPAGLEAAFRQLGLQGVRPVEEQVHKLQIALAKIRNAPDVLGSDKAAAVQAFNARLAELRQQAGQAGQATQALGESADGTGGKLAAAAHKAAAWGTALLGLNQLKGLAEQVVETGSQFENLQTRLQNLLGDTQKAAQAFDMIKRLAAGTPFEVTALAESFVRLTAMGMQPTEAQMRSLSDVAANLGGGVEALSGVTLALGQAWAKGKLQGEELLQLAERGVPVWDALAAATGRTVPELQRMSSAGLLGRDVIARLIDELGRMNAGASDKLMNTYAGAVANAKDALAEFLALVADAGVLDWLTGKVRELLAEFDRMKQTGELQAKARQVADAFLHLATLAEKTTRALVDMAPAMAAAAKLMLAVKGANMSAALLGSAASALKLTAGMHGVAASAGAASAGMASAGAASAAAATRMGAASAAGTRLAASLRLIRSLTGAGLVLTGIELLTSWLGRSRQAARQAQQALQETFAAPPDNALARAAQNAANNLQQATARADDLRAAFERLTAEGARADEALARVGKDFDLASQPGIRDAAQVLDTLAAQGEISARQFQDAWQDALKDVDLLGFETRARAAFDGSAEGARQLQQVLDAGLREALRRSGQDFDVLSGGMGRAARDALANVDIIIGNLQRLRDKGVDTARALSASLGKAIDTADSQAAIDAITTRVKELRGELGEQVTNGLLEQAAQKARELGDELDRAKAGIDSLREAHAELGIRAREELAATAARGVQAYEAIKAAGQQEGESAVAWQQRKRQAAEVMIGRLIAANGGVASAAIKARAAQEGVALAIDEVGRATVRAAGQSAQATGEMAQGWQGVAGAVQQASQQVQEYQRRMQQKYGRPGEGDPISQIKPETAVVTGSTDVRNQWIARHLGERHIDDERAQQIYGKQALLDYWRSLGITSSRDGSLEAMRAEVERLKRALARDSAGDMRRDQGREQGRHPGGSDTGGPSTTVRIQLQGRAERTIRTNADGAREVQALLRELGAAKSRYGRGA